MEMHSADQLVADIGNVGQGVQESGTLNRELELQLAQTSAQKRKLQDDLTKERKQVEGWTWQVSRFSPQDPKTDRHL